jgi:hypothetical protein
MIRLGRSIAIAVATSLTLIGLVGCTQHQPLTTPENASSATTPGGVRGVGEPIGNLTAGPFFVERALIYPQQIEPGDSEETAHQGNSTLFIYLLIRPAADEDKRTEALRAYSCYVPSPGTGPSQSKKAIFLVPARLIAGAKLDERDRGQLFRQLTTDGYDYDAANKLIWEVGRWSNTTPDARGIFVVEVDQPIQLNPRRGRAYDLAALPSDVVRDWIIDEMSNVEDGWNADNLPKIHRARPSWSAVISTVGDLFQIVPASNASRIPAFCP